MIYIYEFSLNKFLKINYIIIFFSSVYFYDLFHIKKFNFFINNFLFIIKSIFTVFYFTKIYIY